MPIVFDCPCGRRIRARDGSAGRAFDCPACGQRMEVPPGDAVELGIQIEDEVPVAIPSITQPPTAAFPMDELVAAIAKGIAVERASFERNRGRLYLSEVVIGLFAVGSGLAMPTQGGAAAICFAICLVGLAILVRIP